VKIFFLRCKAIQIAINLDDSQVNHVVSSMSARDRKILEELVRDSILYGLSEQESLDYIKRRAVGIRISRSNFYAIKQRISREEVDTLQKRLSNHARVGYALSHFQIIDQIKGIQKILFQTLLEESSKPSERKNLFAISRLSSNLLDNFQALRTLNLDAPFVVAYKAEIDKVKNLKRSAEQTVVREPIPTALTIPFDSICGKSQELSKEEREADKPVF
jgi:hypothetical protein